MGGDEIRRPPRWAEALLRTCLSTREAETESGDLLEAYRDSIYPTRGRWRADIWYVRQVVGYVLRGRGMKLRNWLLAGLALCVLTIVVTVLMFPGRNLALASPLAKVAVGLLFYGYAAVWRTRTASFEDAVVQRLAVRYGIAIGALWTVAFFAANLGIWTGLPWPVLAMFAFLLPLIAGAHASIRLWRVRAGMRVGFWSGLISGLMTFFAFVVLGYILAFVPGFPGAEIPRNQPYTAAEFQEVNVMESLGGGLWSLFYLGGAYAVLGGAVGGLAGILLARTGRGEGESRRILWSALTCCVIGSAILKGI
jgi:hypothetical protein